MWLTIVWGIISRIPRGAWIGLVLIVGVLLYGQYTARKAAARVEAQWQQKMLIEKQRQEDVKREELRKAAQRALADAFKIQQLEQEVTNAVTEAQKLKNANRVCIPKSITDRLRRKQR